jgi:hypothetical protein
VRLEGLSSATVHPFKKYVLHICFLVNSMLSIGDRIINSAVQKRNNLDDIIM